MISGKEGRKNEQNLRKWIGRLYDLYAPRLLSLCLRYCGNREDAEDVLQEGFIKILRHLGHFKSQSPGSLEAWMKRIMVNTALNHLRDHTKDRLMLSIETYLERDDLIDEPEEDPDLLWKSIITKDQLMDMICALPPGYRTVFNLYVMEEYTHKEIAELLNCSENTSKSQLSKARALLRKRLKDYLKSKGYEKPTLSYR